MKTIAGHVCATDTAYAFIVEAESIEPALAALEPSLPDTGPARIELTDGARSLTAYYANGKRVPLG